MKDHGSITTPWPDLSLLLLYVLLSPAVPISVRFLTGHFDSWTQNFYRFSTGAVTLLVIALLWFRPALGQALRSRRAMWAAALLGLSCVLGQYLTVEALTRIPAGLGVLIRLIGLPLNLVTAMVLFRDERHVASRGRLVAGAALAMAGAAGVTLFKSTTQHAIADGETWQYTLGCVFMLASTAVDCAFLLLAKRLVTSAPPMGAATVTVALQTLFCLPPTLLWGNLSRVAAAPAGANAVLFASGAYGILIGVVLNFIVVRKAGLVRLNFAVLASPIVTAAFGYVLLNDRLTMLQAAFGSIVIAGCLLVLLSRSRTAPAPTTGTIETVPP